MSETLTNFNWIDLIFVILLLGMVYKGIKTGVGGQILSIIGWFLLLFLSINYYNLLSEALFGFLLQKWAKPVSFLTISVVIFALIKILERAFHLVGDEEFSAIERVGGAVISAFRAVILLGLIGMFFLLIPVEYMHKSVTEGSKTCMFFIELDAEIYSWMTGIINEESKKQKEDVVQEFLDSAKKEYVSPT